MSLSCKQEKLFSFLCLLGGGGGGAFLPLAKTGLRSMVLGQIFTEDLDQVGNLCHE